MIRICFVCLGNICRSPMAKFIMKDKLNKLSLSNHFFITSKATSYEEEGNDLYYKAKEKLLEKEIPISKHTSKRLEKEDYNNFDYFICMEQKNIPNVLNIFKEDKENKVFCLYDITDNKKDIKDPWYTNNFEQTYEELDQGIDILIEKLTKE